jgi:hypothetical protein
VPREKKSVGGSYEPEKREEITECVLAENGKSNYRATDTFSQSRVYFAYQREEGLICLPTGGEAEPHCGVREGAGSPGSTGRVLGGEARAVASSSSIGGRPCVSIRGRRREFAGFEWAGLQFSIGLHHRLGLVGACMMARDDIIPVPLNERATII